MQHPYHGAHGLQVRGRAGNLVKADALLKRGLKQTKALIRYRILLQILSDGEKLQLHAVARKLDFA